MKIEAKEGFTFKRIHDGFIMGEIIYLGIDYSTGEPREDKAEYYEEVAKIDEEFPYNELINQNKQDEDTTE